MLPRAASVPVSETESSAEAAPSSSAREGVGAARAAKAAAKVMESPKPAARPVPRKSEVASSSSASPVVLRARDKCYNCLKAHAD